MGKDNSTGLWCVHILGPDDVIAFPDRQSAEREAATINEAMADHAARRPSDDNWPLLKAVVEAWPYSSEEHAADIAKNIRDMECDGNG